MPLRVLSSLSPCPSRSVARSRLLLFVPECWLHPGHFAPRSHPHLCCFMTRSHLHLGLFEVVLRPLHPRVSAALWPVRAYSSSCLNLGCIPAVSHSICTRILVTLLPVPRRARISATPWPPPPLPFAPTSRPLRGTFCSPFAPAPPRMHAFVLLLSECCFYASCYHAAYTVLEGLCNHIARIVGQNRRVGICFFLLLFALAH